MMLVFPYHLGVLGIAPWGFSPLRPIGGGRMFRFFGVIE